MTPRHRMGTDEKCPVCGRWSSRIVMDHDHATGYCRERICQGCNVTIGALENGRMEACLAYIAKWKALHGVVPGTPYTEYLRRHKKRAETARRQRSPLLPVDWRAGRMVRRP